MDDLKKVSSIQLYMFWKNLSIGLLAIIVMFTLSKLLPFYLSPVISLICAAVLYTMLYNNRMERSPSCMLVPYVVFFCFISYTFVTIVLNVLYAWGLIVLDSEFIFFNNPYVPSLVMIPISFIVVTVVYFRRHRLKLCVNCRINNGDSYERGNLGRILANESKVQLKNLMFVFGILSAIIWFYYLKIYVKIDPNARDWYVFTWLTIISFIIDEVYFIYRYYNLYLDLKENDEIIEPEVIEDMTAKTYLRFYVVCGNHVFVNHHGVDPKRPHQEVIDTPFFTKRTVNGISLADVKKIVRLQTGIEDGHLKFFYGRKSPDIPNHTLLRYFYFLDGDVSDYSDMDVEGEWMDFEKIKRTYSLNPGHLAPISVTDLTRLATIMQTYKTFDENGERRVKIPGYNPTFNMVDVRNTDLDFQDDKWIKVSLFNSDVRGFRFKRWLRSLKGKKNNSNSWS